MNREPGTVNCGGSAAAAPFFLYLAYTAAHWPLQAFPEDIAKYKGAYDAGYNPVREARHRRLIELGLLPPGSKLTPPDNTPWEKIQDKEWEIRCMEVYAAMIDRMDQGIARIIDTLKATNQYDNTLILYLHDNGACAEIFTQLPDGNFRWHNGPPTDHAARRALINNSVRAAAPKAKYPPLGPNDLQPKNYPVQTRDGRPMRTGPGVMPGPDDTYIGYGQDWANVSNTPFREYKHWVHEGGIATPLIVHWPAGIPPALHNTLVRTPAHLIDIAATCLDLAGATYPTHRSVAAAGSAEIPLGGRREASSNPPSGNLALPDSPPPLTPLAGISLRPLLTGQPITRPAPLFWEHEGNRAVRDGDWKLVAKGPDAPWELYDMATDRTELNNLAAQHPAIAARLAAAWEAWAIAAKAKPWPWTKTDTSPKTEKKKKKKKK